MDSWDKVDGGGQLLILGTGVAISVLLFVLGRLINQHKHYELIAGYNRAPSEVQERYDIEGLAAHVGDGLGALGVLLLISLAFLYFGLHM